MWGQTVQLRRPVSGFASTHPYYAHLDGIRALAVLSVLLFHLDHSILPGGFVGVDVFFVLSGYLITGVILREIEQGRFSVARFYQRRIARIFPAFAVVIAATYVASLYLYSAQDIASVGTSGAAAALSLINMKLIFQGDYFTISQDAQPLLHYWSLSVEEQFYFLYPLALLWLTKRRILPPLLGAAAVSFACAIVLTYLAKDIAFYTLPTRAWELLGGGALAVWHARREATRRPGLAELGLVGLLLSFLFLGPEHFPGPTAAFPVLATLAILEGSRAEGSRVQRYLAWRPAVAIGLLSYSLYLWHWPIFSFIDYRLFAASAEVRLALKVVLTVVLSVASYFLIERPARRYFNRQGMVRAALLFFVTGVLALSAVGYYLRESHYLGADRGDIAAGGIEAVSGHDRDVLLLGDSQAYMYALQLAELAREEEFNLRVAGMPAGNLLRGEEETVWSDVASMVAREQPDVIVFAYAWGIKIGEHPERLAQAMRHLTSHTGKIVLVQQMPLLSDDVTRQSIREGLRPPFVEPEDRGSKRRSGAAVVDTYASQATIVDVFPIFDGPDGTRVIGEDGRFLYQDAGHLSDSGAALTMPLFEEAIR